MRYGVPYMGSKNSIAKALCEQIPVHGFKHFYDLFAGGCAVTHRMLELGNFETYTINDIDGDGIELFLNAIRGEFSKPEYYKWVSREEFEQKKRCDAFIKLCWSFGNKGNTYLYGRQIEPWKKALHYAVVYEDYTLLNQYDRRLQGILSQGQTITERRLKVRCKESKEIIKKLSLNGKEGLNSLESLQHLERLQHLESSQHLERLQSLESLQHLERLQSLERLQHLESSYDEVTIKPQSVIYCDIPYKGTATYRSNDDAPFDYDKFYSWTEQQKELVLISEYNMPEERFAKVWEIRKTVSLCSQTTGYSNERLFVPRGQLQRYNEAMSKKKLFQL